MATASEIILASQIEAVQKNATLHGWKFKLLDAASFLLGLPTKDGSEFTVMAKCDGFAPTPPAWHWYNPETKAIDAPCDTPLGGSFLHTAGVICAPWNRLAYKEVDPRGPHSEWTIGNWMAIPETGGTRTLAAMAIRIAHELRTSFTKRMG
jgi:hypothetical protein